MERGGGLHMMSETAGAQNPNRMIIDPFGRRSELSTSGGSGQGAWLSSQQYREYLDLLKQRTLANQVVSVPMTPAQYPGVNLGGGGNTLAPYATTQPGYSFLAPRNASKAAGYGGSPSPRPVVPPRRQP
jgi:hypothetical protein